MREREKDDVCLYERDQEQYREMDRERERQRKCERETDQSTLNLFLAFLCPLLVGAPILKLKGPVLLFHPIHASEHTKFWSGSIFPVR